MSTVFLPGLVLAAAAASEWLSWASARRLGRARGTHLLTCPGTGERAAVRVDCFRSVLGGVEPILRVRSCSHWPARSDCGRQCLAALAHEPGKGLVRDLLGEWYRGRACCVCGLAIEPILWTERPPSLMAPDGTTREAAEVPPERLLETLSVHRPVCYTCHVIETLRRRRPDLMVADRTAATDRGASARGTPAGH